MALDLDVLFTKLPMANLGYATQLVASCGVFSQAMAGLRHCSQPSLLLSDSDIPFGS